MNTNDQVLNVETGRSTRRNRGKLKIIAAVLLAVIFGLSACSSDSDSGDASDTGASSGEPQTIAITASDDFKFDPSKFTITAGEEVTISLSSTGALEHDLVIDEADFDLTAPGGETADGKLTVDEPGTYTYYCTVAGHREAGMEGTLTVE